MATFNNVSVKSLRDADAIYAQLNKVKINDFISVKKVKIQPGVVFLSYYPLVDRISWEKNRKRKEKNENGETLSVSTSTDGRWRKYSTVRKVDREKVSLTAYLLTKQEDDFTPARVKHASISAFKARVLSDAKDVACGFGMEVNELLALTFKDAFAENLFPRRNCISTSISVTSPSPSFNTLPSLPSRPADNFLDATLTTHDHLINKGPGTTRMEEQQFANSGSGTSRNDNGDWTTCTSPAGQRRRWGRLDEDVVRSERCTKRKASNDAPEKTRKKQATLLSNVTVSASDHLSQSVGEHFMSVASSSSTSDTRLGCVGFRSFQEVTQLQDSPPLTGPREDSVQLDYSLHESLTSREDFFEEYPIHWERFADISDIPRIPTWQPRRNLDHDDVVFQSQHGHGESFSLRPSQDQQNFSESFLPSPHFEYTPESRRDGYLQNADQLHQHSFDESFPSQERALENYHGHGENLNFALQPEGTPVSVTTCTSLSSQHMLSEDHQIQHHPPETPLRFQIYPPESSWLGFA